MVAAGALALIVHDYFWHEAAFAATHHLGSDWATTDKYERRP